MHLSCGSVPDMLMSRNEQVLNDPDLPGDEDVLSGLLVSRFLEDPPTKNMCRVTLVQLVLLWT